MSAPAGHDLGYIDYYGILGVEEGAKPGVVRKEYREKMRKLLDAIAASELTRAGRSRLLLEMAQLNAALYILCEEKLREAYCKERAALIALEASWRAAWDTADAQSDSLRRDFERRMRDFLSRYIEESMLAAGRHPECIEASHWDEAHERHAFRILRSYRQEQYQKILERLPFVEVTPPVVDWDERARFIAAMAAGSEN